jgi:hypothetical protein
MFSKAAKVDNINATEAFHVISYHTAYAGEAHTIGENLIKPCEVEMAVCMIHEQAKKKLESLQLPKNAVHCRIQDPSANMEDTLLLPLQTYDTLSLQTDESTAVISSTSA